MIKQFKLLGVLCVLLLSMSAPAMAAGNISRTPWEMYRTGNWQWLPSTSPNHGDPSEYASASIPAENAGAANPLGATGTNGWVPAPDGNIIAFGNDNASILPRKYMTNPKTGIYESSCQNAVDFTYFQTFVTVPSNVNVTQFSINFSGMDDGSRITIFNSAHPAGIVVPGSYVYLGATKTTDLSSYVVAGVNRVVITQVDDCPIGNKLQSAVVSLNGQAIAANTFTYKDFCDLSNMTLSGTTATLGNPVMFAGHCALRLTNDLSQAGGGFETNPVSLANKASFSTAFSFNIHNNVGIGDSDGPGADGFVFVVQTQSNQYGGNGGGIGYYGINNSLGVEFDTFDNGASDNYDGNHIGIDLNGSLTSVIQQHIGTRLNNGATWYAWVDYDGSTKVLEVRLASTPVRPATPTLSYTVDLPAVLGQNDAYVGFTSGTGAGGASHDILSWEFVSDFAPISSAPTANQPPVLTLLGDASTTVEAGTTYADAGATASDVEDGNLTSKIKVTGSVNTAVLGTYTLTYSVTDSGGLSASPVTRQVTVVDTTPPTWTSFPADATVEAYGDTSPTATGTPTAKDLFLKSVTHADTQVDPTVITNKVVRVITRDWTATDTSDNSISKAQTITVKDTTPPSFDSLPLADITGVQATSPAGATVSFDLPTATDIVDKSPVVTCSPASGSTFKLGDTLVTCTATDEAGNSSSAGFTVNVVDTLPPIVTAQLVPIPTGHGESDEHRDKGLFKVVFSATDQPLASPVDPNPVITATLNGATVTNGQVVKLERGKHAKVESDDGMLEIKGLSFTLNVSATDFSGNTGTAQASYAFPVHHEEHEDNGIHRGNDKADHHVDEGKHKSEGKSKIEHKKGKHD